MLAANDGALAAGADGVPAFRPDVSYVNEFQSHLKSDGAGAVQRIRRRRRFVLELEIGVKCGEVQRDIVAKVLQHPVAELAELAVVVVERGNDEIGDLEPDVGLVPQPFQRIQHRLQVRERDLGIEIFGERFQVNVGGE